MTSESASLVPDTQAVLLLTATFDQRAGGAKPLTLAEYNAVASWLGKEKLRPAALLGHEARLPSGEGLPDAERLRALLGRGVQMAVVLERWQQIGLWVVSRGEPAYPERLRRVLKSQAPPLLFGAGDIGRLALGGVAMVGSRDVSEDGLAFTRRCAERCVAEGKQIVSGGARGVDRAAVDAALEAGGGSVAVVSSKLVTEATAKQNKDAIRRGKLTLACPYEPDAPFTVWRAMGRNKHLYALSDRAVVVQFTQDEGGTWAGAIERLAANEKGPTTIPVFVREKGNALAGLAELLRRGAIALKDEATNEPGWTDREAVAAPVAPASLFDRIESAPEPEVEQPAPEPVIVPVAAPPVEEKEESPAPPPVFDCYRVCLAQILQVVREKQPSKSGAAKLVAERLGLLLAQAKAWLERALTDGVIIEKKVGRATRYLVAEAPVLAKGDAA